MVIDSYSSHHSKKTAAVLAKYTDRLTIVPLPTYSPKLDLIERLWKHLRRQVTHNHLFPSITGLIDAVKQFFVQMNNHHADVLSVIGNVQ